ncbi:hypothetical protein V8G54_003075 [Vigna mungo]|uniref:Retrotransposon gag domain-containing protein n=1 Tax=Vigna mungo TaxID=3915 RepID=A0AAQ3PB46_VIGMU
MEKFKDSSLFNEFSKCTSHRTQSSISSDLFQNDDNVTTKLRKGEELKNLGLLKYGPNRTSLTLGTDPGGSVDPVCGGNDKWVSPELGAWATRTSNDGDAWRLLSRSDFRCWVRWSLAHISALSTTPVGYGGSRDGRTTAATTVEYIRGGIKEEGINIIPNGKTGGKEKSNDKASGKGSEAKRYERRSRTVRQRGSEAKQRRMEGSLIATESSVEELRAEMRAVTCKLQAFGRTRGRRTRNQDRSFEGSRDSVNEEWERQPSENPKYESEEDRGEVRHNWMKRVELPTFKGTNPMSWIAKVEKIFNLQSMTEKEKMKLVYRCMEGGASYWFRFWRKKTRPLTWKMFTDTLTQRFGRLNRGTVFEKLAAVRQKGKEVQHGEDVEQAEFMPHDPRDLLTTMERA